MSASSSQSKSLFPPLGDIKHCELGARVKEHFFELFPGEVDRSASWLKRLVKGFTSVGDAVSQYNSAGAFFKRGSSEVSYLWLHDASLAGVCAWDELSARKLVDNMFFTGEERGLPVVVVPRLDAYRGVDESLPFREFPMFRELEKQAVIGKATRFLDGYGLFIEPVYFINGVNDFSPERLLAFGSDLKTL